MVSEVAYYLITSYIQKGRDGHLLTGDAISFGFQATVLVTGDYNGDGRDDLWIYLERASKLFVKIEPLGPMTIGAPIVFGEQGEPIDAQYQIFQKYYGW